VIAAALKAVASPAGRLIAAGLAGAVLVTGIYRTGVNAERNRGEATTLRRTVESLQAQQQTAIEIQTRQAERMAELRVAMQQREEATDEIVRTFRAQPAAAACLLGDAERMRFRAIRIGSARANPAAR
jgi:hypothetical protein